jgi:hypothetical protein
MASSATELTAVLANPAPIEESWCVLCSLGTLRGLYKDPLVQTAR